MSKLGIIDYNIEGSTLDARLKWASECGFKFIEIMPPSVVIDDASESDAVEQARAVRSLVNSYGMRVSAFSARNDFVQLDPDLIQAQIRRMHRVLDVAKILDEEAVVRMEGGWEKDSVPREKWGDAMYECFSRCIDLVAQRNVHLAIDNHGTVTNNADLLIALLKRLNCPLIGSNLDTMNLRWLGTDLETCKRYTKELAPWVKHVHLKDGIGCRDQYKGMALGDGEIDLEYALAQLKLAGYKGAYAAEYEGTEIAGGVGYAKCLAWMKAHV